MTQIGTLNLLELSSFFIVWSGLYFFLCGRNPGRSKEWHCRSVTIIHALIITVMAGFSTFYLGPWPWDDAGGPNTSIQIHTCCLCLAYFLFDLSWCLYYNTEGGVMLAHHFLSILGLSWCLVAGKYGTELLATIGGAEVTNPLLQLRWFIKELGHYDTVFGDVVDAVFMLSFGFMRIYMGTILLYRYYMQPTDIYGRIGGTLIYIIGWVFFINIVNYAMYKYTKRYRAWMASGGASGPVTSLSVKLSNSSGDELDGKDSKGDAAVIHEKEIPTQRQLKHRDGELSLRKNCVVKDSL